MTNERKKQSYRKLKEINLLDNFLFNEVVSGEKGEWFCRYFLELLLGHEVGKIQIRSQENVQGADVMLHGIRMDLYVDEDGGALYDFEPDKYSTGKNLPRRARFYHALTDSKRLEAGVDYDKIRNLWIIFILPFDPFGAGRMQYTARMRFEELPQFPYEDGLRIVYLNTQGNREENRQLSQLLQYMQQSTEENAVTEELKDLDEYIRGIKKKQEVGVKYMRLWELENMIRKEAREEGLKEGQKEGRKEGREEGQKEGMNNGILVGISKSVLLVLEEKGNVPDDLALRIRQEKDITTLQKWLGIAAKSESVEAFQEKIK